MSNSKSMRLMGLLGATLLVVAACSTAAPTAAPTDGPTAEPTQNTGPFKLGYSNGGGVGNGFREEQVCTFKAEVAALGADKVSPDYNLIHRDTDAAGQLSDLRDLIAAGVDAIIFNPNGPDALNPALKEAHDAGIVTVSVDAYVTDANTWNLYNNQIKYAELGAKWLFDQLGGEGTVWYTRGLAGHPADSDRDIGFNNVLKDYPNITVFPDAAGVHTGWNPANATQLTNDLIGSGQYDQIDGIWASGMGTQIVDAIKAANKPFVPIADADIGGFVNQLLDEAGYPGLVGAAVTNTAAVGGAGAGMAYKLLTGQPVEQSEGAGRPNTFLLDPQILDNTTDEGKTNLQAWISVPGMDPFWPLGLEVPGWTTYDPNTVPSTCSGA